MVHRRRHCSWPVSARDLPRTSAPTQTLSAQVQQAPSTWCWTGQHCSMQLSALRPSQTTAPARSPHPAVRPFKPTAPHLACRFPLMPSQSMSTLPDRKSSNLWRRSAAALAARVRGHNAMIRPLSTRSVRSRVRVSALKVRPPRRRMHSRALLTSASALADACPCSRAVRVNLQEGHLMRLCLLALHLRCEHECCLSLASALAVGAGWS